jgi:hypothetical protein
MPARQTQQEEKGMKQFRMDAGKIFDTNHAEIGEAIGSSKASYDFLAKHAKGGRDKEAEADFWAVIAEHERRAFIVGFKVAASLFAASIVETKAKRQAAQS